MSRLRCVAILTLIALMSAPHPAWLRAVQPALHARAEIGNTPPAELGAGPAPIVAGHRLRHRWVHIANNFQAAGNVERVNAILDRANAAGFNGAMLQDGKFGRLDDGSLIPAYYTNLRAVLEHAQALGMDTVPGTADFGYSGALLWHDPNLAEGMPVREAPFRCESATLVPLAAGAPRLVNGDFESLPASGDAFPGWAFQDAPGRATFVDRDIRHGGQASLRMVDLGTTNAPSGNGRVHQRLAVEPFRHYHVSVWVKTQDFHGGEVRVLALGQHPNRTLQWNNVPVQTTQEWTRFDVTFNTLTHREILFYLGVWGGDRGTIWWDDAQIEPAGWVNVIRRDGAPLRLTSEDGAISYEEGRDVEPVRDPRMGQAPWSGAYDLWHEPPIVRVPAGSRIAEGQVVRASYYHMTSIYGDQVAASLTEPRVFDIVAGQMAALRREFGAAGMFRGWMFNHDEIRVHGWDEAPRFGAGTPGENLAYNIQRLCGLARDLDPTAAICVWSDMFDPHHNAAPSSDPYYLVDGDWSGSWAGLPSDVVIVNWNHQADKRSDSARFFADRGHGQILAGYYDTAPDRFFDRAWLADLEGIPRIEGVMYTQWGSGYANLEAWADHVWGDAPRPWGSEPPRPAAGWELGTGR